MLRLPLRAFARLEYLLPSVAKEDFARVLTMLSGEYKKSLEDVCNELAERKAKLNELRDTYFI